MTAVGITFCSVLIQGQLVEADRHGDNRGQWHYPAEKGDIEAVEALISMSSCWKARSHTAHDLRPLTPSSDISEEGMLVPGSADFQESPFVSILSSYSCPDRPNGGTVASRNTFWPINLEPFGLESKYFFSVKQKKPCGPEILSP